MLTHIWCKDSAQACPMMMEHLPCLEKLREKVCLTVKLCFRRGPMVQSLTAQTKQSGVGTCTKNKCFNVSLHAPDPNPCSWIAVPLAKWVYSPLVDLHSKTGRKKNEDGRWERHMQSYRILWHLNCIRMVTAMYISSVPILTLPTTFFLVTP